MKRLVFKICGMDCPDEIAVLKRDLAPVVGKETNLRFDLINGKMVVDFGGQPIDEVTIREIVSRTGMKAIPWSEHVAGTSEDENVRSRHARAIMCFSSGACLALGLAVHSAEHGLFHSIVGGDVEPQSVPLLAILLYCAAIVTGAWFVFPKAIVSAKRLRPDMNLLMTVAVLGAIAIGEWFEAGTVTFLFSVALLLESWSVARARGAISALLDLSPTMARILGSGTTSPREVRAEEVSPGATVLVRPGEKIPLDGVIEKGSTSVNQAPITGESLPVSKGVGDQVFAGTINEDGAVEFRVTKRSEDTTLARIIEMVEEAQSRRATSEQWVESFAYYYTPLMMLLALLICFVPPLAFGGLWHRWIYEALVILVIACPCALVISTPVSIVAGLSAAARAGVLIKGGIYLESPAKLDVVALDKTGTLTRGKPEVQEIVPLNGHTREELLKRAASLESASEHPLGRAILRKADTEKLAYSSAEDFQAIKGKGAEARIDGRQFWIGSHRLLHEKGGETERVHRRALELEGAGHSVVVIGSDRHVCGLISVADELRQESREAVRALKSAGIRKIVMLTGDNEGTARAVAAAAGVDAYESELLPEDKVKAVRALVRDYGRVAMVGDGINDAPAMAEASLGIAMGAAGTDAAIETADIALLSDDLSRLPWLVRHSRRTLRIIVQNIAFALGVKLVFIVLALGGIATLWMAIAADMGASLLVIFNGLRLLRLEPT